MLRFVLALALALPLFSLSSASDLDAQVAASNVEAKLLLSRAREAQMPGWNAPGRETPEVSSFRGQFRVRLYDYTDPKVTKETDGSLIQYWESRVATRGKNKGKPQSRYRRDLSSDVTKEVLVLTSEWEDWCWRRKDKGKKAGRVVVMNKKDDERERAKLNAEKLRVGRLFRIFLLATLPIETSTARMGAVRNQKLTLSFGRNEYTYVTDQVVFKDRNGNHYQLWIDKKSHRPVKARVRFADTKSWETFTMAEHYEVPLPNADASQGTKKKTDEKAGEKAGESGDKKKVAPAKLVVPCNVVYHDAENRPVLMLSTDKPVEAFGFNAFATMDKKARRKIFPIIE